jgi:hypothetical protein
MKPGDLVRVNLPALSYYSLKFGINGSLGIILSLGKRGPLNVWKIVLANGTKISLEPSSLEMISEAG